MFSKQYSHSVFKGREPEMIAHGELVAALTPEDQGWYRAVLKDFDDNTNTVLVSYRRNCYSNMFQLTTVHLSVI